MEKSHGLMEMGKATAIFENIENSDASLEEKCLAIYAVINMDTHNGIKKDSMIKVIRWMWNNIREYSEAVKEE